jgi:peptidoglycan hydrolase-like protein with peptidoglycan-binding domain
MTGPPSLNIRDPVAVLVVQRYLTRAGFFVAQDGQWSERMAAQVLAYQRAHGLPATGIADGATLAAIRRTSSSTTMPAVRPPER